MSESATDLPLESRDALRKAALLGEEFALIVLLDTGIAASDLDALFDHGVFVALPANRARFSRPEQRAEVLEAIPWSARRRWSEEIATVLECHRAPASELAHCFLAAQNFPAARSQYVRAAEKCCLDRNFDEALGYLRAAFEIWPPTEDPEDRNRVLREMARCAANSGQAEVARLAWEELLESAHGRGDREAQIEALRQLADLSNGRQNWLECRQYLERAARLSSALGDPLREAQHWFGYAGFLISNVRLRDASEAIDTAFAAAERAEDSALLCEILASRALTRAMTGKTDEAFALVDKAINLAIREKLPDQLTIAYRRLANVNEQSSRYERYRDDELDALERCRLHHDNDREKSCLSCLAYAFFRLGQWKRSQEILRILEEEMDLEGELRVIAPVVKSAICALRGERRTAQATYDEAIREIGLHGGIYMEFVLHGAKGYLALLDGENKIAREHFQNLVALWRETDDRHDAIPGLLLASTCHADMGNSAELAECIDILNTIFSENPNSESRSARMAVQAENAWIHGQVDEAIKLVTKALAGYEELKTPLEIAHVARRLGLMLASKGEHAAAEIPWQRAESIARELGMRPLLQQLEKDRAATGVKRAHATDAKSLGITPRQLDVLRQISQGQTNKEAAAALHLSPRTVEMHVASLLERLHCRARTDAIRKATKLGLV